MNPSNLVGLQIDQYLIEAHIARGGMAEVYLATDVMLQRKVALKVMLSELAVDQTATARFQREAEAVARLNHPNIIQIYTTGVTPDNRRYLAMQYVPGGTLQQKLSDLSRQGQQMPVGDTLYLGRQVAAALQVAHAHEIVHRDLKPSNILLRSDGEPVLTDLGIAAVETETSRLTRTGNVMGTPHYMSPEQALGKNVDGRSDIYSLGVILYEMLSGEVPFAAGSPLAVLHQHVHETPRSLTQVRPGLSRSTYQTVDTCLQKEPDRRFQTAQQLAAALDHSLLSEGLKTPEAVTSYPTVITPDKRRWWPVWSIAILVMLFAAIAVGYLLAKPGEPDIPELPERAPAQLPTIVVVTSAPSDLAAPAIISTNVALSTAVVSLDPGCSRGSEIPAYIGENGDPCLGEASLLDLGSEAPGCFEVGEISPSPDNDHFAVVLRCFEGDNDAFIFRANGSEKKRLTGEWDYINHDQYTWTTDGYFVYQRVNSCCAVPSPEAPPEGIVWYDPLTDQKQLFISPSPLDLYEVVGVASDDVLNIRANPGAENRIVGSIPFDGSEILVTGLVTRVDGDQWVPVRYRDFTGWVNGYYIQTQSIEVPTAAPLTSPDITAAFQTTAPAIDGSLTEWPGDPSYLSAHLVFQDETWDETEDVEAVWQLGWDNENLYVAVTVHDNVHVQATSDTKIWQGDSVEMQFDADLQGDFGTTLNSDDYQLNISPGDFRGVPPAHHFWRSSDGGRYQWIGENDIVMAARELSEGGYALEVVIPWQELALSPMLDLKIGIALNVSDNDVPGTAVQEVMKSSAQDRNFTHPDTWGTLTLKE